MNLKTGRNPLLHAEDVLRYGAKGIEVNRESVINLFKSVKNYPGVSGVAISHFSLASVASAPDVVEEISDILEVDEKCWLSGQTGIETGSPELMKRHMRGKCRPFTPEEWPGVVLNAFETLLENRWVPCATLIMGLPGETERDVELTISLIEELRSFKSLIVPLFLVSMGGLRGKTESFNVDEMTPEHAELFLKCWEHNLDWAPTIIKEWTNISFRSSMFRRGLRFVFSYGIRQCKKLIRLCRDEYDNDLPAMIRDFRTGMMKGESLPIRLMRPLLQLTHR